MLTTKIWDFWADKYEALWVQKHSLGPTRNAVEEVLAPLLMKNKKYRLLDMGCGTGQLIRRLQAAFHGYEIEYTGVDISPKMIEQCKRKDNESGYHVSSIENFETLPGSYDFIICSHSFPYYEDQAMAVEKFSHLLNKDGYFILVQASVNSIYDQIAMFFVKLTTSKAHYPSVKRVLHLVSSKFEVMKIIKIKEQFYMPLICLFLLRKDYNNENPAH